VGGYIAQLIDVNGLPLLSCLVVSGILVYLGMHVVERKVIFVDLALAQIAALGVMWAILMGYDHETDTLPVTLYSLAFTAIGAVVFSITRSRHERVPHEALIGIIYVTASAGGLVLADRFALGTEALKELIAGRVALVTPEILGKLAITCAVVAVVFVALHRRFIRISRDPAEAEAAGMSIRAWDFLFYMLFGMLITQSVSVLGVLPVFAYLVIPAVAGAFLFSTIRARLITHHFGLQHVVVGERILERDSRGDDPAVELRQGHVHRDIARIAAEPSIPWIDVQARADILYFYNFDPVGGIGIDAGPARCNPLIWDVRMRDMLAPEFFKKITRSWFRMHYQFIMANDMRAPYEYMMLVCGPVPVEQWARRGRDILAGFTPDASYRPT
jgi:zinc/manganese transport system permease protein